MSSTMWITRPVATALLVMMTGLPAVAQTQIAAADRERPGDVAIQELGHAPLLGSSRDSAELKQNFENPRNQVLLAQAGRRLGLTSVEYSNFKEQVAIGHAYWGRIPRHLDKMTWGAGGTVHVLQGVYIPANQYGMRVEVPKQDGTGKYIVYLPAKCGNLSYVFQKRTPLVASASY